MGKYLLHNSAWIILFLFQFNTSVSQSTYNANQSVTPPTVDGNGTDACWQQASWKSIDQLWLGTAPSAADFQGKYKVAWSGTTLYILAEIVDDVLYDGHTGALDQWYNDDCLEIFIDEDRSKGDHQCNYNAFAYHVAINGDVVDLGTDCNPHLYNSTITSARTNAGTTYTWEVAMTIYPATYTDAGPNTGVSLFDGKVSGLSLAYCDDDGSNTRESFIGSEIMPSGHNDDNYKTADYFGTLNLKGPVVTSVTDPTDEQLRDDQMLERYIYNLQGQLVFQETQPIAHALPLRHLTQGIYIVKVVTASGFRTKKIFVE
ncbi:MAG: T9SS type A sorting domain-containing protein [Cytophagaceae bacterium]|nr:T9SS type A sorting domain-containing protein [Cytophagaceae bacterium]